jgi:hypothetical protein
MMSLLFKSLNSPEILVEVLGILGNLSISDFDFAKLSEAYKLHDFISNSLARAATASRQQSILPATTNGGQEARSGVADDDDITLEVINLLSTMVVDDGMAIIVAKTTIIQSLLELMMAKEEDDEIILQITYCVFNLLKHESTQSILISKTRISFPLTPPEIVSYLIDLLYDRNAEIRKLCDACLDIIVDIDEEWVVKIQMQKFQWHNSEWLGSITEGEAGEGYEESAVIYANRKGIEAARQRGREASEEYHDYADSSDEDERMFQQTMQNSI